MLLTFAEVQFLLSLTCTEPELDVMQLLEEPSRDADDVVAAGLASLVAQGRCVEEDDGEHRVVSLDQALIEVHAALHGATSAVRITTVAPGRTTFWLLLVGPERLVLTPAATGVYHVRAISAETDLRQQVAAIVCSALVDEPVAGVSITRCRSARTSSWAACRRATTSGPPRSTSSSTRCS